MGMQSKKMAMLKIKKLYQGNSYKKKKTVGQIDPM